MILKKVFATAMAVCCMAGSYVNSSVIALEETVPEFTDEPYVTLNGNQPEFAETELTTEAFESRSSHEERGLKSRKAEMQLSVRAISLAEHVSHKQKRPCICREF